MPLIPSLTPALVLLGASLIIAGMMLLILGRRPSEVEGGGIIMIGPIPIVFGTSKKIVRTLIIVGTALFIILLFAFAG